MPHGFEATWRRIGGALLANQRFRRQAQDELFDCASRDEIA